MQSKEYFQKFRNEIPALERCVYLNTAGSGPLPLPALHAITDSYNRLAYFGQTNADLISDNKARLEVVRKNIANFVKAKAEEIFFVRCIAEAVNTVAYMIDWKPGDEVIISDQENPATILPFLNLKKKGIIIKKLHITTDQGEMLQSFKTLLTEKTRLVMICQVMHAIGVRLPIKEMAAAAHEKGILFAVDAAQSVGVVPVDVHDLGCDFYMLASHKWIMGPEGATAVYIKEELVGKMDPPFAGVGTEASFDLDNDTMVYKPGVAKYEYGGRHLSLYFGMDKAVDLLERIGIDEVYGRSLQLGAYFREKLSKVPGLTVLNPYSQEYGSGIVSFKVQGMDHRDFTKKAWKEGQIIINWRTIDLHTKEEGIRTSMAWFLKEEELDYFVDYLGYYLSKA